MCSLLAFLLTLTAFNVQLIAIKETIDVYNLFKEKKKQELRVNKGTNSSLSIFLNNDNVNGKGKSSFSIKGGGVDVIKSGDSKYIVLPRNTSKPTSGTPKR